MRKLFLAVFMLGCSALFSQNSFSLRYFGLTVHPFGDQTASLQPYKLDKNAFVVANFGAFASVDHYVWHDIVAVTFMQAAFTDCSGGLAGFTHIGVRALILERKKHRLLFGLGPLFYYREDWNRFEIYEDAGFFNRYHSRNLGDIQYKIFPVGMEFAWHYEICKNLDFNFGFTPGLPVALSFSAGISWWPKRFETKEHPVRLVVPKKKKGESH
jgi:hypothetical protein